MRTEPRSTHGVNRRRSYQLLATTAMLSLAALTLAASAAPVAQRLAVGHSDLDPTFIEPYRARFALEAAAPGETPKANGWWTDSVQFVERGEDRLLRREVARFDADGKQDMWRVHWVDATTLAPRVTHHREGIGLPTIQQLDFDGAKVTATVLQTEQPAVHVTRELEEAPFDLSIWATLLMSVPRQVGYQAEIPTVGPGMTLAWEQITVEAAETLTLPDGRRIDTLRISTQQRPWSAWISPQAPYLIKTIQNLPDGTVQTSWLAEED